MLIVEDGTGLSDADSNVSLDEYATYGGNRGWTLAATDAENEINLRLGFDALNRNWNFLGSSLTDGQAGHFPLSGATEVPRDIKYAQMELAYQIQSGIDIMPTSIANSIGSEKVKIGPIEVETGATVSNGRPVIRAVTGLLRVYLAAGAGQTALYRG